MNEDKNIAENKTERQRKLSDVEAKVSVKLADKIMEQHNYLQSCHKYLLYL